MCNFGLTPDPGSDAEILRQFDEVLESVGLGTQRLHLGPGGSFFTDAEVGEALRIEVIRHLWRLPFLRSLGIETRAPFVTFDRLSQVVEALPPGVSSLTLGFGLECLSDLGRLAAINKGYGPEHIERALEVMRGVEERFDSRVRINFEVYVLLKPLFYSEAEAIPEAITTIEWAFGHGAETTVLFLNTIKENTIQEFMARPETPAQIRYRPPYLRTAVEVLRQLPDSSRQRTVVLGPQSAVPANHMPRSCPLCSWPINGALVAHNLYRDAPLLDSIAATTCPCKHQWLSELEIPAVPFASRVAQGLDLLELSLGLPSATSFAEAVDPAEDDPDGVVSTSVEHAPSH